MKKGYIAAVLDEAFAKDVRNWAQFSNVHGKHVTIAYNPSDEIFNKYAHRFGDRILVHVVQICNNEKCQAAVVQGVPTENVVPHITISCADGVKPAESNTMLNSHHRRKNVAGFVGLATIRFVQHQGSSKKDVPGSEIDLADPRFHESYGDH